MITNRDPDLKQNQCRVWVLKLNKNLLSMIGVVILLIIVVFAVFAPVLTKCNPTDIYMNNRLSKPNWEYLMGTDEFGRSIFSRVIYGSRISLTVGLIVVIVTGVLGAFMGLIAGYYSFLDKFIMLIMDSLMAFPAILLGIALAAATQASQWNVVIALSVVYIPRTVRIVRSSVLQNKEVAYIKAAKAIGAKDIRILWKHLLPNALSSLIIQQTFIFAYAILAEAALSFIGVGIPPPAPSWGNIMTEGRNYLQVAPWISFFPGIFLFMTVLSLTIVGDAIRDIFDVKQK